MAKIEFGWSIASGASDKGPHRDSYMQDVERGFEIITGHFSSFWFIDHLQFDDNDLLEGWTALTYWAAKHLELSFGHAVICQSFRNPGLLAKMGATLQYMSGGRFILGIGAGWHEPEYRSYGYDFPSAGTRVEELDEYLQIVKALWTQEKATFEGEHYKIVEAYCEPKPDPVPPIMLGAFKPRMLNLTARHADWWNVSWTGIDKYRELATDFERACAEENRDPATVRRGWFGGCSLAPTEEQAHEQIDNRFTTSTGFVGTPEQVVEQMRPFIELGVTYFMFSCGGFPDLTTLRLLVDEVLPAVNG